MFMKWVACNAFLVTNQVLRISAEIWSWSFSAVIHLSACSTAVLLLSGLTTTADCSGAWVVTTMSLTAPLPWPETIVRALWPYWPAAPWPVTWLSVATLLHQRCPQTSASSSHSPLLPSTTTRAAAVTTNQKSVFIVSTNQSQALPLPMTHQFGKVGSSLSWDKAIIMDTCVNVN